MTTNPLARLQPSHSSGIDRLEQHCDGLNKLQWVKASGRPYFVSQKTDDNGQISYSVDRRA